MKNLERLVFTVLLLGFTLFCGSVSAMAGDNTAEFQVYSVQRDWSTMDVYVTGRISKEAIANQDIVNVGFGITKTEANAKSEKTVISEKVYKEISSDSKGNSYSDENYYYYGVKINKTDLNNFYVSGFTEYKDGAVVYESNSPRKFNSNETPIIF